MGQGARERRDRKGYGKYYNKANPPTPRVVRVVPAKFAPATWFLRMAILYNNFKALYCNFRSLAFWGLLGSLIRQLNVYLISTLRSEAKIMCVFVL